MPEESKNMNLGAVWTPNDQTSVKFDYWSVDYRDVITIESAQGLSLIHIPSPRDTA